MCLAKGRLQLTTTGIVGLKLSVDQFFISLAEDKGEKALGVILSGFPHAIPSIQQ
ncbi:MAG: chemotaxis protein CheB [Gammaproteobacteria bacterium]